MVDLTEYIQESYIVNKSLYESIKDSITCVICTNIIIKPTMCMNCQKLIAEVALSTGITLKITVRINVIIQSTKKAL